MSVIWCVEVEEYSPYSLYRTYMVTEGVDLVFVVVIDCVVYIERRMLGIMDIVHDIVECLSTQVIMSRLKPVDADENGVGSCVNGNSAVRIYDDGEETDTACVVNDVLKSILAISPDEGLAASKVQGATPLTAE